MVDSKLSSFKYLRGPAIRCFSFASVYRKGDLCYSVCMNYFVLAFYRLASIENPQEEVIKHKEFLSKLDAKARIYISEDGINGQMSLAKTDTEKYLTWMEEQEAFKKISFKLSEWHEHAFA